MGMTETIYRKTKISQAKSAGNKDALLKRIKSQVWIKKAAVNQLDLEPKGPRSSFTTDFRASQMMRVRA
jgi:hypothetical protein